MLRKKETFAGMILVKFVKLPARSIAGKLICLRVCTRASVGATDKLAYRNQSNNLGCKSID